MSKKFEIQEDFFEKIDTKEKAYFLGLLFADGWIEHDKKSLRLGFKTKKEDIELMYKLCNALNLDPKKEIKPFHKNVLRMRKGNKKLISDLMKIGFIAGKEKSKNIEFPNLSNRKLELAFLLGYYDGDGTINKSKISSGSLKFVEHIKKKFNIPNKIHKEFGWGGIFEGRKIIGDKYDFFLGANLMNQMMENYTDSLSRKRKRFWEPGDKAPPRKRLNVCKEELENLVNQKTQVEIAKIFGVSLSTINRRIKKWNIKLPPKNYSNKIKKK